MKTRRHHHQKVNLKPGRRISFAVLIMDGGQNGGDIHLGIDLSTVLRLHLGTITIVDREMTGCMHEACNPYA